MRKLLTTTLAIIMAVSLSYCSQENPSNDLRNESHSHLKPANNHSRALTEKDKSKPNYPVQPNKDRNSSMTLNEGDRVLYIRFYQPFNQNKKGYSYSFKDSTGRDITINSKHPVLDHHEIKGRVLGIAYNRQLSSITYQKESRNGIVKAAERPFPQSKANFAMINLTHDYSDITLVHNGETTIKACNRGTEKTVCAVNKTNQGTLSSGNTNNHFSVTLTRDELTNNPASKTVESNRELLVYSLSNFNQISVYEDTFSERLGTNITQIPYIRYDKTSPTGVRNRALPYRFTETVRPFGMSIASLPTRDFDSNQYIRDSRHLIKSNLPIILGVNILMLPDQEHYIPPPGYSCRSDTLSTLEQYGDLNKNEVIKEGATLYTYINAKEIITYSPQCNLNFSHPHQFHNDERQRILEDRHIFPHTQFSKDGFNITYSKVMGP